MEAVVLLADGFETIEALTVVDVLRRAGTSCTTVSSMSTREVMSAQQIAIIADAVLEDVDFTEIDCLVVPGGLPSTRRFLANKEVCAIIKEFTNKRIMAASSTAPSILAAVGVLSGRKATVFPGCEVDFPEGSLVKQPIVVDGKLITSAGMGYSIEFAQQVLLAMSGVTALKKAQHGITPFTTNEV